ncbi:MAG: PAS domain-containing protein [Anaerolineae bacterium]|nr:PAS domain-containing protein [Anaerolineae bacterium]
MTNQPQSDPREVSGVLSRVNQLGTATEQFFSRLYSSFNRRSQLREDLAKYQRAYQRKSKLLHLREEELQHLNSILANIDQGIIVQNNEGRISFINAAARKLLGSQKAFWDSELASLFQAYQDVEHLDTEITPLSEPARVQINNRILGAQVAAIADENGQRQGTMIVLRDVTRDALSDRLKDQFITAISHELRTPMAAIKGMSEVILGQPEGQPVNRRFLDTIGRNVDILDRMIVELLDISEMSADAFSIRQDPLNLERLIWNVVEGIKPEAVRAKLDIMLMLGDTEQLNVIGDDQRLRWALGHLLQNSVHYTEADGNIVITSRLEDDGHAAIQVVDTGVGITERDLPHVFERFYRGEARTRSGKLLDPRGLGQGLFIARRVAEAHEGYLTVNSSPGMGSVFTMVLPISSS